MARCWWATPKKSGKILRHSEALGGISRISFQMDVAELPQANHLRSIELVGSRVTPALREKA
jgi:hypothetical protein